MSDLTLGLDLGPSSIGWALMDETHGRLHGTGVRVFPEGVDRDTKGGELSKNETRRIARGMRRQIARRARRKRKLRELLAGAGLLPPSALLDRDHADRVAWEHEQFQAADPYALRAKGVTEALTPHELGRVLLHLNQRRGFKSNRKADKARKKENSDMLKAISSLAEKIGDKTLGQYLHELRGTDEKQFHMTRLRGLHTRRDMLEAEFEKIWTAQQPHHGPLTDDLKTRIHRCIFFQREMYWPASVIGHCELEPRLPRCPRSDRRAQRFRLYQEINNLRVMDKSQEADRPLTPEERDSLITYLSGAKERSFDQIRKHLFDQHEGIQFNLERGERKKLLGLPTDALLSHKSLFGKTWADFAEEDKNRLVAAIHGGEESKIEKAAEKLGVTDPDLLEALYDSDLGDGYTSYSLYAIKKLLPPLERGLQLTSRDASIPCALREAGYLMPWEKAVNRQPFLPNPPLVTNPLVRSALHEVRKVVNAILRELVYRPGHKLAHIRVELAREARGTSEQRKQFSRDRQERENERDEAADEIRKHGSKPSRDAIDRYLLWKEQGRVCVYSGRSIGLAQLLGGEIDVDHVLPYPRSLDNSFNNRVVCFRNENAAKTDRTPYEWLAESNPNRYEQLLQRADKLPFAKARRFRIKHFELDDFFARQYVDTTYITTQVHQYVQCLGADVTALRGSHTAELRHHWGMDRILRDDGLNLKNREDHRHHAVDAIVIALSNRGRMQQLARIGRQGGTQTTGEVLDDPWMDFRSHAEAAVNAIYVSHKPRRKVKGALHEETLYGRTEKKGEFVYRKPVESLTRSMVDNIRDAKIKELVLQRLDAFKEAIGEGQKIPKEVWARPLTMPSGVPIKKVRLLKLDQTIQPLRPNANVKPGSLHHACIFDLPGNGRQRKDAVYVTMLEASLRIRDKQPVIHRTHPDQPAAKFVMSVTTGDMLLATFEGTEKLVIVSTLVSTQKRIHIVDARDARQSAKRKNEGKTPSSLEARKVTVDPIGRLRWAND